MYENIHYVAHDTRDREANPAAVVIHVCPAPTPGSPSMMQGTEDREGVLIGCACGGSWDSSHLDKHRSPGNILNVGSLGPLCANSTAASRHRPKQLHW